MPTILTNQDLGWNTTFSLNTTPKKFILTYIDVFTAAGVALSGVKGVFKITSPSGTVIYANTVFGAGSDIVADISLTNAILLPLPNLSNQAPETGIYTIQSTCQIIDGTNPTYYITATNTYNFTYASPSVSIVPQVDCIQPLFSVSDTSNYIVGGITPTNTRTITLDYPANSGGTPVTNTTSATITTSTFFNGLQAVTVSSVLSYTVSTGFFIADTVTGTKSINVDCSYVCQLYCCLKSLRNRKENARCVDTVLFERYEKQFAEVMAELEMLFLAIDCGKQADANNHILKIKDLAECADDCACTDGTPTLVTGLGIQNVNVVVVSGGTPIIVTSATVGGITTYTVSFDAALVTKINNSYNTVVTAGTNVTVTDSGVISGVRTFTVNAAIIPTALSDSQWFRCSVTYTAPSTVVIATSNFQSQGSNMINATVTDVSVANGNNLFKVNAFQTAGNNTYKVWIEFDQLRTIGKSGIVAEDIQYKVFQKYYVWILNQKSNEFYFQFIDTDGLPVTTKTLALYVKEILLNILIK